MKNDVPNKLIITLILIVCCFVLVSCKTTERIEYYSDIANYVTASGTVTFINRDDDNKVVYIGFSELSPSFSDSCFKISGINYELVEQNGLFEVLSIGQQVTFKTATKYFGDGYVFPIVSIMIGDKTYLDFEEGMPNYVKELT